jgi:hypothetical protein
MRRMQVSLQEFAAYKALLFFNPDASGELSRQRREQILAERNRYSALLFHLVAAAAGDRGLNKYSNLLYVEYFFIHLKVVLII